MLAILKFQNPQNPCSYCTYIHILFAIYVHICAYVCMYVYICMLHACLCVCVYMHVVKRVFAYIYYSIYTYTSIPTKAPFKHCLCFFCFCLLALHYRPFTWSDVNRMHTNAFTLLLDVTHIYMHVPGRSLYLYNTMLGLVTHTCVHIVETNAYIFVHMHV